MDKIVIVITLSAFVAAGVILTAIKNRRLKREREARRNTNSKIDKPTPERVTEFERTGVLYLDEREETQFFDKTHNQDLE